MARTLSFQQITDSRFMEKEDCLKVLDERISKIKKLLDIEGVEVRVDKPYLLDWGEVEGVQPFIQYRANFKVRKTTRKTTWNDIYDIVNSVKAVPYKF